MITKSWKRNECMSTSERGKEKEREREGRRQIEIERGRETGGRELFERSEITTRNYFWDL